MSTTAHVLKRAFGTLSPCKRAMSITLSSRQRQNRTMLCTIIQKSLEASPAQTQLGKLLRAQAVTCFA